MTLRLPGIGWIATALVLVGSPRAGGAEVPRPDAHLGFVPGADFRLAGWSTVADYFGKVDAASDRVAVTELGRSTEGRPYLVAAVSSEATIRDLASFQKRQKSLADPGSATPTSSDADLIQASKPVVLITCSIHSNETASTLMAMELLHGLATGTDPATREILDNTILLLVPSANPDGVDKVADWYERTKGHPWEGEGMPTLYHKYAGHDTNRDWFMLNLAETRILTRLLYHQWFPTLAYDVHQMGGRGARLFVPPFFDPVNPNLDPRVNQGIFLIGSHMAADLASAGKQGVLTNAMYDNWWNGGNRTAPQRHNIVAVLTEAASVKLATPVFLEKDQLRGATRGFSSHDPAVNFIDPWPGGWWRLRDIVDYELICARSILTLASRYRHQFQSNYLDMARTQIRKGRTEPPFGWVVPADQRDLGTAARMVEILHASGVQVRKASAPVTADGVEYPAGSWVISAAQPYRAHVKDLMERQVYPNRLGANGQAEPPYDVAGWTLPLQMGVKAIALGNPLAGLDAMPRLDRVDPPTGSISDKDKAEVFVIHPQGNDDFLVLNALLAAEVEVRAVGGTPVCNATPEAHKVLDRVIPTVSTEVEGRARSSLDWDRSRVFLPPAIALYQPWVPSMDEGWTRLVLERFGFPYTTVHDADVRAGRLTDRFRTIVLPSTSVKNLRTGHEPNSTEPAYVGGLGAEGGAALRAFVQEGGTLVCLEDSCSYVIEEFGLPISNVLKGLSTATFYAPGSILRCELDDTPRAVGQDSEPFSVAAGMPREFSAYFDHSLAFDSTGPNLGTVMARYAKNNTLESGWLLGPEKVQGKAAVIDYRLDRGRIILFGFPPQHRGQTHGTFRLLFQSLYATEPAGRNP